MNKINCPPPSYDEPLLHQTDNDLRGLPTYKGQGMSEMFEVLNQSIL